MSHIKINPLQLVKAEHAELLALLLAQKSEQKWVFAKGVEHQVCVPRPGKAPKIVRIRLRLANKKDFAVIDDERLDEGYWYASQDLIKDGGLYDVLGKVRIEDNKAICTPYKIPKLFKRVHYGLDENPNDPQRKTAIYHELNNEEQALKRIPYLYAKEPKVTYEDNVVEETPTPKAGLFLNRIEGITLHQYRMESDSITITKLYLISIRLLRAFHEQIHAAGLVHCDIKADNILIDPNTLSLHVVDVGSACKIGERAKLKNRDYVAPEAVLPNLGRATAATDAYSIGLLLRQFCWQAAGRFGGQRPQNDQELKVMLAAFEASLAEGKDPAVDAPLFVGGLEEKLSLERRNEIQFIMNQLNQFSPAGRMDIPSAITELERGFSRYCSEWSNVDVNQLELARLAAEQMRFAFSRLTNENQNEAWPIGDMMRVLRAALRQVPNQKACVRHFTNLAGIAVFHGLETKAAIEEKALLIFTQLTDNTQKMMKGIQQFQAAEVWLQAHKPKEAQAFKNQHIKLANQFLKYQQQAKKLNRFCDADGIMQMPMRLGFDELARFNAIGKFYCERMQQKTQNLQHFLRRQKATYVTNYADLLARLQIKPKEYDESDALNELKNKLHTALQTYLQARKHLTKRRYQDVEAFIRLSEKATNQAQFLAAVQERNAQICTGFWNRSKLRKAIQQNLRADSALIVPARQR